MKKSLVAAGLVFMFVGLVTTALAAAFRTEVAVTKESWDTTKAWEISGEFREGERLIFHMTPGKFWFGEPLGPSSGFPFDAAIFIDVSIIDPKGGKTVFTAVYAQVPTEQPQPLWEFFAAGLKSNDGGLSMEEDALWWKIDETMYYNYYGYPSVMKRGFGGIITYNGTYKVIVNQERPTEPAKLELFRQKVSFEQPFSSGIPIGATILSIGIAFGIWGIWGVRKPKYRARRLKTAKHR